MSVVGPGDIRGNVRFVDPKQVTSTSSQLVRLRPPSPEVRRNHRLQVVTEVVCTGAPLSELSRRLRGRLGPNPVLTSACHFQAPYEEDIRMNTSRVFALLVVIAAVCAGCERTDMTAGRTSVTVRLPPARAVSPEPGFSFAVSRPRS